MNKIPVIKDNFTNRNGIYFDNVREIVYKKGELCGNLGKYITETIYDKNNYFVNAEETGVYIYQSYHNPNLGYRIYKTFNEPKFNGNNDDILIQRLFESQKKLDDIKFPTGVVTLEGNIIGQEMYFFKDDITIFDYFKNNKVNHKDISIIYYKVLEILNKMYCNGILYWDIHGKNFMINPNLKNINIDIIDFDYFKMSFDNNITKTCVNRMFSNYATMINLLNKIIGFDENIIGEFPVVDNFDTAYKELKQHQKRLVK